VTLAEASRGALGAHALAVEVVAAGLVVRISVDEHHAGSLSQISHYAMTRRSFT
jgi:hypothetical protein